MEGFSAKTFGPSIIMTREQFVTMMFRCAAKHDVDVSARADLSKYTDAKQISDWARDAMEWAVACGLVVGRNETTLPPRGSMTRAELTAIIHRYDTNQLKKAA